MASEKKPIKNDRLMIRLESEVRGKLRERAGKLGLDEAAYVRMLIYAEVNEVDHARAPARPDHSWPDRAVAADSGWPAPDRGVPALDEPDPPPVEEMEIPADPDGDPLGPDASLLDEIAALTAAPRHNQPAETPAYARHRPSGTQFRSRFHNRDWGRVGWSGPGSLTRAVGVGSDLIGNVQGDGRGNVTRDNFAHFGAVGTRSR